ncbi:MAG: hypothetical protein M1820_001007 [Bogoriella megaspora]|nr:MAG: hypothetical protein M1820_001007 [Bogoriella megaspora]
MVEVKDHPEGDEIRRQVEYYFSDANLPYDSHLLAKCGGQANEPVSIKSISGFPRMRRYKPFSQVVNALRLSNELEVVEGNCIRRRKPLTLPLQVKPEVAEVHKMELKSQGLSKNMLKPTGFEDGATEAPITPEVYNQERELYDPNFPFSDRIETAVQRFVARRKFHSDTNRIFNGWLKFGGINHGPRMFTGGFNRDDLEDMTADQIGEVKAMHYCLDDVDNASKWVVDFEGVAKAYFSDFAPTHQHGDVDSPEKIENATRILRNFYNYLLQHDVCLEHTAAIYAARRVCDIATTELTSIHHLTNSLLPGDFNRACSLLFGSDAQRLKEYDPQYYKPSFPLSTARLIIKTGIAALGSAEMFAAAEKNKEFTWFKEVEEKTMGMEVISTQSPSPEVKELYTRPELSNALLRPLGMVTVRPWRGEDFVEYDLPEGLGRDDSAHPEFLEGGTLTLWMEEEILALLTKAENNGGAGTKIMGTLKKIFIAGEGGKDAEFWFLDEFEQVYASFYTVLPNDLLKHWRAPTVAPRMLKELGLEEGDVDDDGRLVELGVRKTEREVITPQEVEDGAGTWEVPSLGEAAAEKGEDIEIVVEDVDAGEEKAFL